MHTETDTRAHLNAEQGAQNEGGGQAEHREHDHVAVLAAEQHAHNAEQALPEFAIGAWFAVVVVMAMLLPLVALCFSLVFLTRSAALALFMASHVLVGIERAANQHGRDDRLRGRTAKRRRRDKRNNHASITKSTNKTRQQEEIQSWREQQKPVT